MRCSVRSCSRRRRRPSIARTNLQRNKDLVAQNFISQSAVDQSRSNLEVAEAQVALARRSSPACSIVAPFDGVVGMRVVNVGDYVKDGADLVNIEDMSSLKVDFRLPERFLAQLRSGQGVQVTLDALPGSQFAARSMRSIRARRQRPLAGRARAAGQCRRQLRPGMFARVRIMIDEREDALVVPEEALVPLGDKQYCSRWSTRVDGKAAHRIRRESGMRRAGQGRDCSRA